MLAAIVLYEDSRTAASRFELHSLALRCLYDDLVARAAVAEGIIVPQWFELEGRFDAQPLNGCNKVIDRCRTQFEALRASAPSSVCDCARRCPRSIDWCALCCAPTTHALRLIRDSVRPLIRSRAL